MIPWGVSEIMVEKRHWNRVGTMHKLEYNINKWDKKRKKAQLQTLTIGIILAGLFIGIAFNAANFFSSSDSFPFLPFGITIAVVLIFLFASLSSWTNYTFLYHYYTSQWFHARQPDSLELMTGSIELSYTVRMPYLGVFKRIQLRLRGGESVTLYAKAELMRGLPKAEQTLRVLTYHMFIVEIKN